jgi:hypothetical protein
LCKFKSKTLICMTIKTQSQYVKFCLYGNLAPKYTKKMTPFFLKQCRCFLLNAERERERERGNDFIFPLFYCYISLYLVVCFLFLSGFFFFFIPNIIFSHFLIFHKEFIPIDYMVLGSKLVKLSITIHILIIKPPII